MSAITFSADIDTTKLDAGLRRANQSVGEWARGVEKNTAGIDVAMSRVGTLIATYFSARALSGFAQEVVNMRGEFQKLNIAFETMLGNKDKADKLMAQAIELAQKTPFTLQDVATNIKQLLAMGIATESVIDTMRSLGDVAAGVSVPISRIAINYGQVATLGKLQGREVRDFAMAGVPLVEELAKMLNKSKTEINEMVTAGQIGFPMVEQAFKNMASEGGKFYNLMEKQNASVTGQISNLTDKWQLMLNAIGESNEGLIYGGINAAGKLIENYETVIDVIQGLIVVLGAAKVATMLVAREQKIQAATALLVAESNNFLVASEARAIVMKVRSTAAQKALNASMIANPYVIATAAIAAVGFALYKIITHQTALEKALKKTTIEIENEKDKALALFSALKATTEGTEDWEKARKEIIDQYGDYLPNQLKEIKNLDDLKKAQDAVNDSISTNVAIRTRNEALADISKTYNESIVEAQADIIKKVEGQLGKERAAMVRLEMAQLVAEYKAGLKGSEEALLNFRQRLMKEVGTVNTEGLATSFSAANMAGVFNPLIYSLENVREETKLVNDSFDEFIKKTDKPFKSAGRSGFIFPTLTAEKQREELRKALAEAETKLKELEDTPGEDPLRAIEEQKGVIDAIKERLGISTKAKKEELTLDQKIEEERSKLETAAIKGNEREMISIAAKITAIERELELREKLTEQILDAQEFKGFVPGTLPGSTSLRKPGTSLADQPGLPGLKPKTDKTPSEQYQEIYKEMNKLRTLNKQIQEDIEKGEENQNDLLEKQQKLRLDIVDSVYSLVNQLGEAAMLTSDQSSQLSATITAFSQLASGDYIGAAASFISELIHIMPNRAADLAGEIEHINRLLQIQENLIQSSERTGGEKELIQGKIDLLKEQEKAIRDQLKNLNIFTASKKDISELANSLADVQAQTEAAQQELKDFRTGGITETIIVDQIAQGFLEGRTSIDDFADYMNTMLTDAVMNIFKAQYLLPVINKEFLPMVDKVLADNTVTDAEVAELAKKGAEIAERFKKPFEDLTQGLDLGGAANKPSANGLGIERLTEETGTEMAGLLRKLSDDGRMNMNFNRLTSEQMMKVEQNTFNTVEELKRAVIELKIIASNTSKEYYQ